MFIKFNALVTSVLAACGAVLPKVSKGHHLMLLFSSSLPSFRLDLSIANQEYGKVIPFSVRKFLLIPGVTERVQRRQSESASQGIFSS